MRQGVNQAMLLLKHSLYQLKGLKPYKFTVC